MTTLPETATTVACELRTVANALVWLQEIGRPPGAEEVQALARCAKQLEDAVGSANAHMAEIHAEIDRTLTKGARV